MISRTLKVFAICCVVAVATVAPLGVTQMASANPRGGPISGVSRVQAFSANVHTIVYNGGEQADFSIVGDGDTTLNIIVRDQNGVEVVRTRGPGDRCHVSWRPTCTSVYRIYVVNEGGVYNEYRWRAY